MNDDLARLSYRDLAERLAISPDAARMKAKRKVKAGLWRIIPGNHPSERVMVELPTADLAERVGGEQAERIRPERSPRTQDPEQANAIAEQFLTQLAAAQERIQALTDQLLEAKEAHRLDSMELAAAETREMGTKAELEQAIGRIVQLEGALYQIRRKPRSWWQRMTRG